MTDPVARDRPERTAALIAASLGICPVCDAQFVRDGHSFDCPLHCGAAGVLPPDVLAAEQLAVDTILLRGHVEDRLNRLLRAARAVAATPAGNISGSKTRAGNRDRLVDRRLAYAELRAVLRAEATGTVPPPAAPGLPTLDEAWREAEAARPLGRVLHLEQRPDLGPDDAFEAWVGPRPIAIAGYGSTPAAALQALVRALAETPGEPHE